MLLLVFFALALSNRLQERTSLLWHSLLATTHRFQTFLKYCAHHSRFLPPRGRRLRGGFKLFSSWPASWPLDVCVRANFFCFCTLRRVRCLVALYVLTPTSSPVCTITTNKSTKRLANELSNSGGGGGPPGASCSFPMCPKYRGQPPRTGRATRGGFVSIGVSRGTL